MNPRFAAIDIGSNSSLLLILEFGVDGIARVVIDTKASTRLSSGTHGGAAMAGEPLARQFTALDRFAEIIKEKQVESVVACGTQVFRNASNGREVAAEITRRYGWEMQVISGEREAELSYRAASTGLSKIAERRVVIDVGGGSSEVIFGKGDKIEWSRSFPIGAVSITDKFGSNLESARSYIEGVLSGLQAVQSKYESTEADTEVVAVGGTAATLAAVNLERKIFNPKTIHGVQLSRIWIENTISRLNGLEIAERRALMPFDPDRADIIVAGALIVLIVLENLKADQVVVSNCGLRWGLITTAFPQLRQARIEQ